MTDKLNPNQQPELSERDAELLSAYIDNMLTDDERNALEARLEKDAFLRQELRAMQQTVAWVKALPTLKAPRNFTVSAEDVRETPVATQAKVIPMQNRNWWLTASAAAALIVVIVGVIAILPQFSGAGSSPEAASNIALQATQVEPPQAVGESDGNDASTLDEATTEDIAAFSVTTAEDTAPTPPDVARNSDTTANTASGAQEAGSAPANNQVQTVRVEQSPVAPENRTVTAQTFASTPAPLPTATPETMTLGAEAPTDAEEPSAESLAMDESVEEEEADLADSDLDDTVGQGGGATTDDAAEAEVGDVAEADTQVLEISVLDNEQQAIPITHIFRIILMILENLQEALQP